MQQHRLRRGAVSGKSAGTAHATSYDVIPKRSKVFHASTRFHSRQIAAGLCPTRTGSADRALITVARVERSQCSRTTGTVIGLY
jgi:hypothetical protein